MVPEEFKELPVLKGVDEADPSELPVLLNKLLWLVI
jgi:hypothetical protein